MNEHTFNVITLVITCFLLFRIGWVKGRIFKAIYRSIDRTEVGKRLKFQKAAESVSYFILGFIYAYALAVEFDLVSNHVLIRALVRLTGDGALVVAWFSNELFLGAFNKYEVVFIEHPKEKGT